MSRVRNRTNRFTGEDQGGGTLDGVIRLRQDTLSRFGGTAERNGEATAPQLVRAKAGRASAQSRSRYPVPQERDCGELHFATAEEIRSFKVRAPTGQTVTHSAH
jgi:hypothetical protein